MTRVLCFYQIQIPLQRQQLRPLLADCRTKSVSSRLGQTRPLPREVSFYKIQPRPGSPGENDLEIVLLGFGKYHAWGVCELHTVFQNDGFAHASEKDLAEGSGINVIIWAFMGRA